LNKLEFPSPKDNLYPVWLNFKENLCQVWLKLAKWFWTRRFLIRPTPFIHFCNHLPFEEDLDIYFNKLEFSSSKYNFHQVWLNLASWFWRRFLKIFNVFLLFCYYLPLEKGCPLRLNKLESPFPKNDLCQVGLKLAQWFWRRSRKCKSLQTNILTPDNGRPEMFTWAFRSAELKINRPKKLHFLFF
jgi:hypothetical protein